MDLRVQLTGVLRGSGARHCGHMAPCCVNISPRHAWHTCGGYIHAAWVRQGAYSDDKAANRYVRVWHGATENGP
jgi:hypothetical protein